MQEIDISNEIFASFAGTIFALLSAGIAWIIKSAFDKYRSETAALVRYERTFALNFEIMTDSFNLLDEWIESIEKQNRPYSAYFASYIIDDQEHYKISDLELVNQIVRINYKLQRSYVDFTYLHESYIGTLAQINSITHENDRLNRLLNFHNSFLPTLKLLSKSRTPLELEILQVTARIQLIYEAHEHSLFKYLSFLYKDIWPRITKKLVDKRFEILRDEAKNKKEASGAKTMNSID